MTMAWADSSWMVDFGVMSFLLRAVLTLVVSVAKSSWSLVARYACFTESAAAPAAAFAETPLSCISLPAVLSCACKGKGSGILKTQAMSPASAIDLNLALFFIGISLLLNAFVRRK